MAAQPPNLADPSTFATAAGLLIVAADNIDPRHSHLTRAMFDFTLI